MRKFSTEDDDTGRPKERSVSRRHVLQATAATGVLSTIGQTGASDPAGNASTEVPDVVVTNFDDRDREITVELALGEDREANESGIVRPHSVTTTTASDTIELSPGEERAVRSGTPGLQAALTTGELETATLLATDDGGAESSLSLDRLGTAAEYTLDVLRYPDELVTVPVHVDTFPSGLDDQGGESR